jgi:Flp pilus assembly protein TadG
MSRISSLRLRTSKGGTIVELALIFILFFALVIGIFDFGQFLFIHQALVERARWAARTGVANSYTDDQIMNLVVYGQSTTGTSAYFGLSKGTISNGACTGGTVCAQDYDINTDNYRTEVRIYNYPYVMLSPYSAGSYTGPNISVDVPRGLYD